MTSNPIPPVLCYSQSQMKPVSCHGENLETIEIKPDICLNFIVSFTHCMYSFVCVCQKAASSVHVKVLAQGEHVSVPVRVKKGTNRSPISCTFYNFK